VETNLVVALDNMDADAALALARGLHDACGVTWFKVGLEQFVAAGPVFVSSLKSFGLNIFLDLKLHDIPNTVSKAIQSAESTGADLITVHALGGPGVISAAAKAANRLKILAVTVLTSHSQAELNQILSAVGEYPVPREQLALHLAKQALSFGAHGIVCSVSDLKFMTKHFAEITKTIVVTPGIRQKGDDAQDQKSTSTPADAIRSGSRLIVVGRPITLPKDGDSIAACNNILKEIHSAMVNK
jgi:orotidine-5'-phosphate decarboxylase